MPEPNDTNSTRETTDEPEPRIVLLVDDDDAFRETLHLWLQDDGRWTVREASDGVTALEKLDEGVDVLTLDRNLLNLSAADVLERLDSHAFAGPVIVLSAYEPNGRLNEEVVAEYLIKPIDKAEFLETIHEHV